MKQSRLVSTIAAAAAAAIAAMACPAAAQQAAPAAYKIGFVNTQRIIRDSRVSQQVQKSLEAEFLKREKEITAGPPAQMERRRTALLEDIGQRRDEALKQFVDKANAAIRRIAEAENFDLVSAEAAYAATRIDLTDKVIKALDAGK